VSQLQSVTRIQFIVLMGALVASALSCAEGTRGGTQDAADFVLADASEDVCDRGDCEPQTPSDAGAAWDGPELPADQCGDGELGRSEACDDGNRRSGDGCEASCLAIELGYACLPAGSACRRIVRCGDSQVSVSEQCDDGNRAGGDGCSAACKLEHGFRCEGAPSSCVATTCGDGKPEGAESCDDANQLPFDGCSATCQTEPVCRGGACTSSCGDGLVLNEDCDDGNRTAGDGCSADCEVEAGFRCAMDGACAMVDGRCVMRVPVIYRDFNESHVDFGGGCGSLTKGVVRSTLGARGKPLLLDGSDACIESASSFAEWYTANANNATILGSLVLYEDGKGGFVNRYGPNGEPWLGPAGDAQQSYDGNPLFFPIDDSPLALEDERWPAAIPEEYGYAGRPLEDTVISSARSHNFHFTTEVVTWFLYDASAPATLDFLGDDDVWVFINGRLAVDLGGLHLPEAGSVTLDATTAAYFGLTDRGVYEVKVFHAERSVDGSSFKLTLRNFDTRASACTPICGDGLVTAGEECDDGANLGGYEQCAPGCVLGPSCGDGIVQESEDCDDGNRVDADGCGSACRSLNLL
jgi:fibro-slime domain-containing protein